MHRSNKSNTMESVHDILLNVVPGVYEIVVELAETCSESLSLKWQDDDYDVLLVSAPIVAWTRYRLPAGTLTPAQQQSLHEAMAEFVAAEGAKVYMLAGLITFDQMLHSFQATRLWAQRLEALSFDTY